MSDNNLPYRLMSSTGYVLQGLSQLVPFRPVSKTMMQFAEVFHVASSIAEINQTKEILIRVEKDKLPDMQRSFRLQDQDLLRVIAVRFPKQNDVKDKKT